MKDRKKVLVGSVSITSVIVLIGASFVPSVLFNSQDEPNVPVSDIDNWDIVVPDDFSNIQSAIDSATPGDRIFVRSDTFDLNSRLFVPSLHITKNDITICGENPRTTILDVHGSPIIIEADNVNFSGFTVTGNDVNGSLMSISYTSNTIIENTIFSIIDIHDGTEYGIKAYAPTNLSFNNNYIYGGDYGFTLQGCIDSRFENNLIEDNNQGISISEGYTSDEYRRPRYLERRISSNNIFINNTILENYDGIFDQDSTNNRYINNTFKSNRGSGLTISSCTTDIINSNTFINDGLKLAGDEISHFIHEIKNNQVNGKPLYYYYNENNKNVPSNAGQIILVKCSSFRIENTIITNTTIAVLLAFSNNNFIQKCEFSNNNYGIYIYYSTNNRISKNNIIQNTQNAFFVYSRFINSKSNTWRNNYWENQFGIRPILRRRPYVIHGRIFLDRPSILYARFLPKIFGIPTRNIDWRPSRTQYTIQTT